MAVIAALWFQSVISCPSKAASSNNVPPLTIRAAITAGLSLAGVVWGWLIRANRQTYPWDKYDMVFRIEVDAFPIVFYNETDYIVQENQKKIFCCFGEKGN